VGQDREDGEGRARIADAGFEDEVRRDRRFERGLLVKEALILLAIALLVAARLLFMR
jgi:hypothetical protein